MQPSSSALRDHKATVLITTLADAIPQFNTGVVVFVNRPCDNMTAVDHSSHGRLESSM